MRGDERRRLRFLQEWDAIKKDLQIGCVGKALERFPLMALADIHLCTQIGKLSRRHQAGVVVLVARQGHAIALDRIGDKADRTLGRSSGSEGIEQNR